MTRQRYTAIKVRVNMLTLKVAVIRGEINLQKNIGKSIPPSRKTLAGNESSINVKSDVDKLKIRMSLTDFRFFFRRIAITSEFPVTPRRNVNTKNTSFIFFSVSLTDE